MSMSESTGSSTESTRLTPVRNFLSPELNERVIKKVFNGNTTDWEKFLDKIESTVSWKEALPFIEEEFSRRKIDVYDDKDATSFTDRIFKRYYPGYYYL